MILLIWLVAPFAEAGVIIGLAIANGRHKKRIQELTCQLERQRLGRHTTRTTSVASVIRLR